MKPEIQKAYNLRPNHTVRNIVLAIVFVVVIGWSLETIVYSGINPNGIVIAKNILNAMIHPNLDWLLNFDRAGTSIPWLMVETIAIAFLGTLLGAILAIPMAFLSARNITGKVVSGVGNTMISIIRTFPYFILGLMFIRVTGPGPLAGVLTIGISSIGMISKLYVEIIEDMDNGILLALDATGATKFQKIRYGIIPQLTASFVSAAIYRFDINVRNATVLGLVGAGGIGFTLIAALAVYRWTDAAAALWGIVVVVLITEALSNWIRQKLVSGQ